MAFQETELHKLHLRLSALEGKPLPSHLLPSTAVLHGSTVKEPEPEAAPDDSKTKKGKG